MREVKRKVGRGHPDCSSQQVLPNSFFCISLAKKLAPRSLRNGVLFQKSTILARVRALLKEERVGSGASG